MASVGSRPVPLGSTGPVPLSSSRSTASASRTSSENAPSRANRTSKAIKASQAKSAKGPNSDHRKEQNRIASKNYREKRKRKLALLRQILDEPADDAQTGSTGAATVAASDSAGLGLGGLPTGLPLAYMAALPDTLPAVFPGNDDLLSTGTNTLQVPSVQSSQAASSSRPSATRNTTTATTSSAWTAANSTSHPSNPFTWLPSGASLDSTLTAAEVSALDIPLCSPWTVPFSSDLSPPFPQFSSSTAPPASLTTPSSSMPSNSMTSENIHSHNLLSGSTAETLFAGIQTQMPPTNALPTGNGNSNSFLTSPLPSRPSPRVLPASLAQSGGNTGAYSAVSSNQGEPDSPSLNRPGPSRRARKKNKPVVRAMLQYVQTLSSHQKRLILQALLDEGEGEGEGEGAGADERVEEVEENDENDDGQGLEDEDDDNHDPARSSSNTDTDITVLQSLQSLHRERCRQAADRWKTSTKKKVLASANATYSNIAISASSGEGDNSYQEASFSSAFSSGFGTTYARGRAHLPPTFMTMTLQCRRLTFCIAILRNSEACGLADPAAMLQEPHIYDVGGGSTADDLQSPFALAADEARAVVVQGPARTAAAVAAVRQALERTGKTPPRDLQPVDAQILVAHHPYIDIIPFRGFRARALALLAEMEAAEEVAAAAQQSANLLYSSAAGAAMPPPEMGATGAPSVPCLLDEDELCYDMTVADGLICWGSEIDNGGTGASSRDKRAGVPWDMRSWEPQVWFLKKYWYLVGSWDDDMWRNCRWWHSMRGEDLDYAVFAAPGY